MEAVLWKTLAASGPFAVLFGVLFWYTLKKNSEREERLMGFMEKTGPLMQQQHDDHDAQVAILERIESKVDNCDVRVAKKEAVQLGRPERA